MHQRFATAKTTIATVQKTTKRAVPRMAVAVEANASTPKRTPRTAGLVAKLARPTNDAPKANVVTKPHSGVASRKCAPTSRLTSRTVGAVAKPVPRANSVAKVDVVQVGSVGVRRPNNASTYRATKRTVGVVAIRVALEPLASRASADVPSNKPTATTNVWISRAILSTAAAAAKPVAED